MLQKDTLNTSILLSKYVVKGEECLSYPLVLSYNFTLSSRFKIKNVLILYLFISIININAGVHTQLLKKARPFNAIMLRYSGRACVSFYLGIFVAIYFPLVDSFRVELGTLKVGRGVLVLCLYKFPIILEFGLIISVVESIAFLLNSHKSILKLVFKKQSIDYIGYSRINKLPVFNPFF